MVSPLTVKMPGTDSDRILTAKKLWGGLSIESEKPKSFTVNGYGVSSRIAMVFEVPLGASLTGVAFTVSVLGVGSRSMPPLAVPPSSWTWKVKVASGEPLAFGAGVNLSLPAVRSARGMDCPAAIGTPVLLVRLPAVGNVVIFTARNVWGGVELGGRESFGSVNPKSATCSTCSVSSRIVIVFSAPLGGSFAGVTLKVSVFGVGSRSAPPLAVPPLSCTWKLKAASDEPFALAGGTNRSPFTMRSVPEMTCPVVIDTPALVVRLAAVGCATVVLYPEIETSRAVEIRRGGEHELARGKHLHGNHIRMKRIGDNGAAIDRQDAGHRQRQNLDR